MGAERAAAPRPVAHSEVAAKAKPTVAGTFELTGPARAKVRRWARTLHKEKAVPYVETIHLRPGSRTLLVELGDAHKGPFALRPAGKQVWSYPLSKKWTVTVAYKPRRDVVKVRVGPVTVTYRRAEIRSPAL